MNRFVFLFVKWLKAILPFLLWSFEALFHFRESLIRALSPFVLLKHEASKFILHIISHWLCEIAWFLLADRSLSSLIVFWLLQGISTCRLWPFVTFLFTWLKKKWVYEFQFHRHLSVLVLISYGFHTFWQPYFWTRYCSLRCH